MKLKKKYRCKNKNKKQREKKNTIIVNCVLWGGTEKSFPILVFFIN
jgi:hypothetical protein